MIFRKLNQIAKGLIMSATADWMCSATEIVYQM